MDNEPPPFSNTEAGKKLNEHVVEKTGFEPADIAEAPFKTPELKRTHRTIGGLQLLLIVIGSAVAVLGLAFVLAYNAVFFGLLLTMLGAAAVVVGALVHL